MERFGIAIALLLTGCADGPPCVRTEQTLSVIFVPNGNGGLNQIWYPVDVCVEYAPERPTPTGDQP